MLSATEIAQQVKAGTASATYFVQTALAKIAQKDRQLNCFTAVFEEKALEDAAEIDRKIANSEAVGPLAGVPFAVKKISSTLLEK